jgi:hypothetical protein
MSLIQYEDLYYEPLFQHPKVEELEQRFDDATEFCEAVYDAIYSDGKLDMDNLQHCLEELAYYLKVPFVWKDKKINICRSI